MTDLLEAGFPSCSQQATSARLRLIRRVRRVSCMMLRLVPACSLAGICNPCSMTCSAAVMQRTVTCVSCQDLHEKYADIRNSRHSKQEKPAFFFFINSRIFFYNSSNRKFDLNQTENSFQQLLGFSRNIIF